MSTPIAFPMVAEGAWIQQLRPYQQENITSLLNAGLDYDGVAELWLGRSGSDRTLGFGSDGTAANYLASLKAEFKKLICGDAEYEITRQKISEHWDKGYTYVITTIAVAISAVVNVAVGVITPVIALLLETVCKLSVNAWCKLPAPTKSLTANNDSN